MGTRRAGIILVIDIVINVQQVEDKTMLRRVFNRVALGSLFGNFLLRKEEIFKEPIGVASYVFKSHNKIINIAEYKDVPMETPDWTKYDVKDLLTVSYRKV